MAGSSRMYSEHWYRVANQRVALRPGVHTRRQRFRGETWRVLYDPFAHNFYRLRPAAYAFVARLSPDRTVEEVWTECLEEMPGEAPGQGEVIQLLAQLYLSNLLQLDLPPDARQFFERYRKRKQKEKASYLSYIMFARFPLYDPDDLLNRIKPYIRMLFSRIGFAIWLAVVLGAVKMAIDNAGLLADQSQGVLAPGNLFMLYVSLVFIKALHEFGHAFACKRYGGEVHVMGIMLMIFTPIPYVDATASWAFRRRRKRILVACSGMIVELFVAAIAMFIWANTGPGTLNALCYNLMFIASVSTVLFNANPLLRYDGYYILSDLLDIPNLSQRAQQQLRTWAQRRILGRKSAVSPAQTRNEAVTLGVYGVLSGLYRVVVFGGIILFVSKRFLLAGIVMAAICIVSWLLVPIFKFIHYLITDPSLERNRLRAISVSAGLALLFGLLIGVVPFPSSFVSPGVLLSDRMTEVPARSDGQIEMMQTPSGTIVSAGRQLVRLQDNEWPFRWQDELALKKHTLALRRRALKEGGADLSVIDEHLALMDRRLARLQTDRQQLQVTAPADGLWVAGALDELKGMPVQRGGVLGYVLDPDAFISVAVISQDEARWLFDESGIRRGRLRLKGSAQAPLELLDWQMIPAEQRRLPSPALGWQGGGEVAVSGRDENGVTALRSFFEVRARVDAQGQDLALMHGRTGRIRFRIAPEPLWRQAYRRIRQILSDD
jgi:putative peptide zinc metalloprotease protein